MKALADRVAASVSPAHPVAFALKNTSSLSASDADLLHAAIEAQLTQHHFRFARTASAAGAAETRIDVTLSESDANYVWVAEIRTKGDAAEPDVAVVNVARTSGSGAAKAATLTLQKTLVWQQLAPFLDFRVTPDSTNGSSAQTLLVLEPSRIAFYSQSAASAPWQPDGSISISHRVPWPRDVRGELNASGPTAATISGVPCTGTIAKDASIICNGTPVSADAKASIPGYETGEALTLSASCDGGTVALASGAGDWTQADAIHGYVVAKSQAMSSGAVELDGPVLELAGGDSTAGARAVVLNLKTGNYEGYVVTATCGQ